MLADRIGDFRHVLSFFVGLQTQFEFEVLPYNFLVLPQEGLLNCLFEVSTPDDS